MRHWSMEERLKQAQLIRSQKPWKSSTGPRTKEGKAVSSRNAFKNGFHDRNMKEVYSFLRECRNMMCYVKEVHKN